MPWRERDWAAWTDEERARYLGTTGSGGASTRKRVAESRRPSAGGSGLNGRLSRGEAILMLVVGAAIIAYLAHRDLRGPSSSPIHRPPVGSIAPRVGTIAPRTHVRMTGLPSTMRRGTYVTSQGTLGTEVSGVVIVEGRWGTGRWYKLATAPARNGRYRVRYLLEKPGLVHLRIALPDGNYLVATTRIS